MRIVAGILMFLAVLGGYAQDVQLTASAKPVVAVGEAFALTYSVNGQAANFRGPRFTGLDILSGPSSATSSSIRSINGRTSMSINCTFTYILQAQREGTIEIPPASVTVDGKNYTSNSVSVKVVSGSAGAGTSQGSQRGGSQPQAAPQSGSGDVFLKAFVSNGNPLMGEGIIVTYKIFTKVPIAQIMINKLSSFSGFWSQNLIKDNDKFHQYNQVIDGEQYVVADIRKIMLFPLKSGKLTIEPLEMECVAQIRQQNRTKTGDPFFDDFFNDSFFSNSYATVQKSLKSNALTINVRPLPAEGKSGDFSGAVGTFKFSSQIDKTSLKTNEPFNLKFTISGKGNIQLIDKLNVSFPPDFETYDPKITSNINTGADGVSGSQDFEYLVIPRKPGKFTIKPVNFTYYDLARRQYVTQTSPEYTINVEKGVGGASAVTYSGASKEDIQYIGSDIRFISTEPVSLMTGNTLLFGSIVFWLLLLVPLLGFIVLVILWRGRMARHNDAVLMRNRKATRVAKKRLTKAEGFLRAGNQEEFYVEISQALWGYLSDKFGIPLAELSMDSVQEALLRKQVSEEIVNGFIATLNDTEFARFAPGDKVLRMDEIYGKALEIISKIERELR